MFGVGIGHEGIGDTHIRQVVRVAQVGSLGCTVAELWWGLVCEIWSSMLGDPWEHGLATQRELTARGCNNGWC